jgi:hypothetical protein
VLALLLLSLLLVPLLTREFFERLELNLLLITSLLILTGFIFLDSFLKPLDFLLAVLGDDLIVPTAPLLRESELEPQGADSLNELNYVEAESLFELVVHLFLVLRVQTVPVGVLVILGADHVKGLLIIDGVSLIFEGVDTSDSELPQKSHIITSLEMSYVALSQHEEDTFKVDFGDVPLQIHNKVLLELLIIAAKVVIDTSRLLFLYKTLVNHILTPSSMRSIHSD